MRQCLWTTSSEQLWLPDQSRHVLVPASSYNVGCEKRLMGACAAMLDIT